MRTFAVILATYIICHVMLIDQSEGMDGLCSTNWMSDDGCFDNDDKCRKAGGQCFHDGMGDHGEGCRCKQKIGEGRNAEWVVLVEHHIPLVPQKTTEKGAPIKYH